MDVGTQEMEGFRMKHYLILGILLILTSCGSSFLKYDKADTLNVNNEFEKQVKIERTEAPASAEDEVLVTGNLDSAPVSTPVVDSQPASKASTKSKTSAKKASSKAVKVKVPAKSAKSVEKKADKAGVAKADEGSEVTDPNKRQPEIEDDEEFTGRRPNVDPYRVGEEVVHTVKYFKVSAGELKFKVEPFAVVNGKKSYSFITEIKSSSVFSNFYSVEDRVEALVSYDDLVATSYALHVKESGQLREGRAFFNQDTHQATYWEKKYTEKSGHEEKKQNWEMQSFSQNVFSAVFYMRAFKWTVGKEISFRVAHDKENILFKGKAIRKEKITTDAGTFNAIVIKPEFTVKGAFRPVGDIFIWLSDDDRKYLLRIESSIKIGTLISEVVSIKPGRKP